MHERELLARSSVAKEPAVTLRRQQVIESLGPAKTAGLRYVSDGHHGIIRRKNPGAGFYYITSASPAGFCAIQRPCVASGRS